jgi:hypothetical protein
MVPYKHFRYLCLFGHVHSTSHREPLKLQPRNAAPPSRILLWDCSSPNSTPKFRPYQSHIRFCD